MRAKRKQYVVFGLGRFGTSAARALSEMGHEVLAIDDHEDKVNDIAPYVTQAMQVNATDEDALRDLELGGFDAAIVAIGSNVRDSVLISVLCKEAGVGNVIAKATDELHAKVLRKVGVDRVIFPERDMAQRLARSLSTPSIVDMLELADGYQIAEVHAPASWAGKTLMQINVRRNYGLTVIAIRRGTQFLTSPGADSQVMSGDMLLVMGQEEDVDAIDRK